MILGSLVIAFPFQEADADHPDVRVNVFVWRGGTLVANYFETDVSCSGEACATEHDLNNRDFNRWNRWCPTNSIDVTITSGENEASAFCEGKGPWFIEIHVRLDNNPALQHGSDVTTTVTVI